MLAIRHIRFFRGFLSARISLRRNWGTTVVQTQLAADQLQDSHDHTLNTPQPDNVAKQYTPKIQKIVQEIAKLTLLEVSELNELLKKTLKIEDVPMMPMSTAVPAAAIPQDDEAESVRQKTSYTVRVIRYDDTKKVSLIKEIKSCIEGMNLVQAKKFVESLPQVVQSNVIKEDAEKLKAQLEAAGGICEID